jgi:hypothetical protein
VLAGVIAVMAVAGPVGAAAQDRPSGPPPIGQREGRGEGPTLAAIEREFDRLEVSEARRALRMDADQFQVVAERLQRIQILRRRHMNQRRLLLAEIRAAVESGSVDTNTDGTAARLVELGNLGVRQAQELRRAGLALDVLLTVRQRAEYRLFQERFERRKLDLIARARAARGAPPRPPR